MVRAKGFAKSLDLMCEGKGRVMDDCSFCFEKRGGWSRGTSVGLGTFVFDFTDRHPSGNIKEKIKFWAGVQGRG